MEDHLRDMLPDRATLSYFGREEAASPATGSAKMHDQEEKEIVAHALENKPVSEVKSPVRAEAVTAAATEPGH